MEKAVLDFRNCLFRFLGNKFQFRILNFSINGEDHDTTAEHIFNDWITFHFNEYIDVDEYKLNGISNMTYEDGYLTINDDHYRVSFEEFTYFVGDFNANLEDCAANVMQYFIAWFLENIGREI